MADGPDAAIAAISGRQHGNVTREQLLGLGLGPAAITYRAKTGRLHRVHRGVYAVGRPPATPLERAAAAVLACGPGAVLSHASAMTLWGWTKQWRSPMHVTVAGDRRRAEIAVHQTLTITRADIRTQLGIRVTSPARTMLDCAPCLSERSLAGTVNDALLSPFLTRSQLADVCRRCLRHPGAALLARFIDTSDGPTRSGWEREFPALCERYGLPRPAVNVPVCGYEVDAYFEPERVIVELDGWATHAGRDSFESDRDRDADTLAAGLVTVRITWDRLTRSPREEIERLDGILSRRRAG